MVRFLWLRCRYKNEPANQAKIKRIYGRIDSQRDIRKLIVIGQGHWGRVIIVQPRGKKVPEGVEMLAFYKQMLYGLLHITHTTGVAVSNFGLENFVASVQDVMVYFKLKHTLKAWCFLWAWMEERIPSGEEVENGITKVRKTRDNNL